jgi:hypothetical protein
MGYLITIEGFRAWALASTIFQFIVHKISKTWSHHCCWVMLWQKSNYFHQKIRTIQVSRILWKLWHLAVTIVKFINWKNTGHLDYYSMGYFITIEGFRVWALTSKIFQFLVHKISETLINHCGLGFARNWIIFIKKVWPFKQAGSHENCSIRL